MKNLKDFGIFEQKKGKKSSYSKPHYFTSEEIEIQRVNICSKSLTKL